MISKEHSPTTGNNTFETLESYLYQIPTIKQIRESLAWLPHHNSEAARNYLQKTYRFEKRGEASNGVVAASYFSWGDTKELDDILNTLRNSGLELQNEEKVISMMENTGFTIGYQLHPSENFLTSKFQAIHALFAAVMTMDHLKQNNKNKINTLLIGSISTVPGVEGITADILKKWGVQVDRTQFYGLACASVSVAMTDEAQKYQDNPTHKSHYTVALGLESLSGKPVATSDATLQRIFGNGGSVIGYESSNLSVLADKKIIIPDEGNIKIPISYEITQKSDSFLSSGYILEPSVNKQQPLIVKSHDGVLLSMYDVDHEHAFAHMKGPETAKFFGKHAPDILIKTILEYYQTHDHPLSSIMISHQPSKVVVELVNGLLHKKLTTICETGVYNNQHVEENTLERLKRYHQINQNTFPSIPWLMEKAKINNISAGTIGVALTQLLKENAIHADTPYLFVGLGVGAVIQASIITFTKNL